MMGALQSLVRAGRRLISAPAFCHKDVKNLGFLTACRLLGAYLTLAVTGRGRGVRKKKLKSLWIKGHDDAVWWRSGTSDSLAIHHVLADREYSPIAQSASAKFIVDCGANIGCASRFFLKEFPEARVVAVESDKGNYEMCLKNLTGFGDRVQVIYGAVSATKTRFACEKGADGDWSNTVRPCRPGEEGDIDGVTLDEILSDSPSGEIDILKIDIEGAERFLFDENCHRWLGRTKNLVIELHDEACETAFFRAMQRYQYHLLTRKNLTFCCSIAPRRTMEGKMPCQLT
jgi:FkbM family methyltransferase